MKAGIYTARAGDREYGYLDAMVAAGDAIFRGTGYDELGRKLLAVEVLPRGARPNPRRTGAIRIGRNFCTNATRAYYQWQEKWWREAIQNSVDAGARNIQCRAVEDYDDRGKRIMVVSCEDDGHGMDEETIIEKFLVLGESGKGDADVEEVTGGFGKAKELLLLPWIRWSVASHHVVISGHGGEWEVEDVAKFRQGVLLEVVMPRDESTDATWAEAFISKCYLPRVNFTVSRGDEPGEEVRAALRKGKYIRSFGDGAADLYYSKKESQFRNLLVRINGLYMFYEHLSESVPGTAIVELRGRSVDLLSDNREDIRDYELRGELSKFLTALATDAKSQLRSKKGLIRKKFKGKGKFTSADTRQLRAAMMEALGRMVPGGKPSGSGRVLSASQQRAVTDVVFSMAGGEQPETAVPEWSLADQAPQPAPPINLRVTVELVKAMLTGLPVEGTTHMESIAKQLSWEPDFYLFNNIEGWRVPKRFYPEKMSPSIRKLLRFWAELCRFMLIKLNESHEYGVGFVFEHDMQGMYLEEEDERWILLNPFFGTYEYEPLISLSNPDHLDHLFGVALHEVTHMILGGSVSYHSEAYASALTYNLGKLRAVSRQVESIRKAVVARAPSKLPKIRSAEAAEYALAAMTLGTRSQGRRTMDQINAELVGDHYLSAADLEAMVARGWLETEWDDAQVEHVYTATDKGFNWQYKRAVAREKRKSRTA